MEIAEKLKKFAGNSGLFYFLADKKGVRKFTIGCGMLNGFEVFSVV